MHLRRKLEGKLWIPHKRIDSKAPYPARVSSLYFRLVVIFKIKFVFCATSFYNWIGVWIRIITKLCGTEKNISLELLGFLFWLY